MFIDRIMSTGFAIAALTTAFAVVVLILVIVYLMNLPVPQVVRLVALVPSPGNVILDDVGDSATLSVQGYYSDQTMADLEADFITYESTDPSVVSVSPGGVVTANGAGGADIVVRFGSFSKQVHALVFGDIPTLPLIDPDMVGPIPGLDEEVRAVLNRVIIELRIGYDTGDAEEIAVELGGEVVFSYGTFPGYVIEFDTQQRDLMAALTQLDGDGRVEAVYPDVLFEQFDHPIDTIDTMLKHGISIPPKDYFDAGFEGAWRMVEKVPIKYPVSIAIIDSYLPDKSSQVVNSIVEEELEWGRIKSFGTYNAGDQHGLQVAGVIVAKNKQANRHANLSGIVSSAGLDYNVISLGYDSFIPLSGLRRSLGKIYTHRNSIDVTNLSFGGFNFLRIPLEVLFHYGSTTGHFRGMSEVVFVVAAGNCQRDAVHHYPAKLSLELDNVITVGGADEEYTNRWTSDPPKCEWLNGNSSSFGDSITIAASAKDVWTLHDHPNVKTPDNGYNFYSGTSFAAPIVSGTVALLRAVDPDATSEELKKLLVETGDEKTICTSTPTSPNTCLSSDEEEWSFLRADKAVAKLLSKRVSAITTDRIAVPPDTQRVVGHRIDFGFDIRNTGEMAWPFYGEAIVRAPNGSTSTLVKPAVNVVAPGKSHQFRWGFWPPASASGCWDSRVKVWMEPPLSSDLRAALMELQPVGAIKDIDDLLSELNGSGLLDYEIETKDIGYMRAALAELTGALNRDVDIEDIGLLADSGWIEEVIEVRSDPNQPEQCSGSDKAIPLPLPDSAGQIGADAKANVLLLADTSGSMEGLKSTALKEAIDIFVNTMSDIRLETKGGIDPDPDHVGLIDFDSDYREVVSIGPIDPAGADLDAWEDVADSLDADGGTALYDAVIRSIDVLEEQGAPSKKNILIALTDGVDQDSSSSLSDAISRLNQSSVTLFAVALSEPGGAGDYDFGVLEEMANATRGAAYAADTGNLPGLYGFFTTMFQIEP